MRLHLVRWADTPYGTFGTLTLPDGWSCYTIELPWLNNAPRVSCIPAGTYPLRLGHYNKGGYPAYELLDVPGRAEIKIHRANRAEDVQGCIGPGAQLGVLHGEWAVMNSGMALEHIMAIMAGRPGELTIAWKDHPAPIVRAGPE